MNKKVVTFLAIIAAMALIALGLRLSSPEDAWVCKNGRWEKHGNPSSQQPTTACR